uniref:NADH-ubiquinone oxidoreductase chain 4 n=1 Tax=Stegobium paniceum TaxID=295656 RepID=A0A4P8D2N0_STEPN|nr:NADH dehydrogenase subunit 4 [Stegobium paniceum]
MMKLLFSMIFMIPLCFNKNYWMSYFVYNSLIFYMILKLSFNYNYLMIGFILGSDLLSYSLILLSLWIVSLMCLASDKIYLYNNYYEVFNIFLLMLMLSLFFTFSSMNLFIFYLFFEVSLIPTLFLVLGWGFQPERLQAGLYLFFYTMFGSLPMLISIFYFLMVKGSLSFFFFFFKLNSFILFFMMNFVFFIKMPMYFVHLWLPKAHTEAPISGSMMLAGVMLKLGGYGLMRILMIFMYMNFLINYVFMIISLVGGFYISLMCLRQSDLKSMVAYSSVAHMGLVICGLMTFSLWGMMGSLSMMLAHGLCSSGLFCLVNMIYERTHTRSLFLNKGLINLVPSLSLWWFLLCSSNMAAPPSLNLLSEILLINSVIGWDYYCMMWVSLLSFFSAAYSLFLFGYTQHGKFYSGSFAFMGCSIREFLLLMMHWLPLNILFLKTDFMMMWL